MKFFTFLFFALPLNLFAQSLEIDVGLRPAGSFKAQTSKVNGFAIVNGNSVSAEKVMIDLKSLSTGVGLRDKHLKERLMVDKYPFAKLLTAKGTNGKGTATIELKGQKKNISGDYKIAGNVLKADFTMKMSELDINDVRYMGVGAKDLVTVHITLPIKE